jgi:hypothetical protein
MFDPPPRPPAPSPEGRPKTEFKAFLKVLFGSLLESREMLSPSVGVEGCGVGASDDADDAGPSGIGEEVDDIDGSPLGRRDQLEAWCVGE